MVRDRADGQDRHVEIRSQHHRFVEALALGQSALVGTTRYVGEAPFQHSELPHPPDLPQQVESSTLQHKVDRASTAFEQLRTRGETRCAQRQLAPVFLLDLSPKRTASQRQLAIDFFRMAGLHVHVIQHIDAAVLPDRLKVVCVLGDPKTDEVNNSLTTLETLRPGLLRYVVLPPPSLPPAWQPLVDDCLHDGMNRLELIHDLHLSLGLV